MRVSSPKLRGSRRVRSGLPDGARQEHHSSAAHEPGIRRNENRDQREHRQSFLASLEFRRHRRAPGAGPEQIGPDSARTARRPMVPGPRHRRWIVHRSVYRTGSPGALWATFTRASRSENIAVSSYADFTPDKINLTDLQLSSPDGHFHGAAQMDDFKRVSVKGEIEGVTIAEVGRLAARETGSLNGTLSGPVQLDGQVTPSGLGGSQRQRRRWI